MGKTSKRQKKLSLKAREAETADLQFSIQSKIKKFNRLVKSQPDPSSENVGKLTDIYLEASVDLEMIHKLNPSYEGSENEQIGNMGKYLDKLNSQQEKLSHVSSRTKSRVATSVCSIQIAKARIQEQEVEAEIQSLRRQHDDELKLKQLQAQLKEQQLLMQVNSLKEKKQKAKLRQQVLEEYDLDERDEINEALVSETMLGAQQSPRVSVPNAQIKITTESNKSDRSPVRSDNQSDMQLLAESIAKSMQTSRLPVPTPPIFSGNPLEYVDWEISFRTLVENTGIPDADRIHYLKQYVTGAAKEAISGNFLLNSSTAYHAAKSKLKERFGSEYAIANAFRTKLENWPKLKPRENVKLQSFADFLGQCATAMQQIEELQVLNDSHYNVTLMGKLPEWLADKWKRKVVMHKKAHGKYPKFNMFVQFINDEADIVNDPILTNKGYVNNSNENESAAYKSVPKPLARQTRQPNHTTLNTGSIQTEHLRIHACLFCSRDNHKTTQCFLLAKRTPLERKEFVESNKLCFACLLPSHMSSECKNRSTCQTCQKSHPTSMHFDIQPRKAPQAAVTSVDRFAKTHKTTAVEQTTPVVSNRQQGQTVVAEEKRAASQKSEPPDTKDSTCRESQANTTGLNSMVVPVWLSAKSNPNLETLVYALLDTMSDTTFVTDEAVADLQITGHQTTLNLSTMTSNNTKVDCQVYDDLMIRGYKSPDKIAVSKAFTRNSIPLDRTHIPNERVAKQWPHLKGLAHEFPELATCKVGMLIGYDTSKALIPLQSVIGENDTDPFAIKTPLGWSIVGNTNKTRGQKQAHTCNRVIRLQNTHHTDKEPKTVTFITDQKHKSEVLPSDILDLLQQDFSQAQTSGQVAMSQDDRKFVATLTKNIKQQDDGHYTMPLPFKSRPVLPNNKHMAEKRFELLRKKFTKDKTYQQDYQKFMDEIIQANDAELVDDETVSTGETWYIPHFGVYHPKKPNKIRVVFDCSAKYKDTCLNDHLLQGPDLMNSLIGVLHRFRKGKIAIMCDIQRMFHMFKVHKSDRSYLRFLWFKDSTMTEIAEYQMNVHLFGATSSPGCATFGLRALANDQANEENSEYSRLATQFITNDFYVDDGLLSLDSPEEAIGVVKSAINVCAKGNLRLHKFVCNNKTVLATIPSSEQAENVKDLDLHSHNSQLPVERALGVQWCIESDQFQFRVTLKDQPLTRRGILSTIASVFDPLGFIAPFILVGKQILQQMCKDGAGWDDPLPENLRAKWQTWRDDLQSLTAIKIARCLTPQNFGTIESTELHHFSDASTLGYGQCSYLRVVNISKQVHCTLLMGKSRVTPLKNITIPRAELQAAVLSAKIAQVLKSELKLENLTREVFWTDSKVVLGYINNESRRFQVYVANRVQQINDVTNPEQWHYVNTTENPADIASRGLSVLKLAESHWFTGPALLYDSNLEVRLGIKGVYPLTPDDPEIKVTTCHLLEGTSEVTTGYQKMTAFSSFKSAVRAVSALKRYVRLKNGSQITKQPNTLDLEQAKTTVLKWAQQSTIEEYYDVEKGTLKKGSQLTKLDPFIDPSGLLRVGGRLNSSDLPFEEKHPIILPTKAHITKLVIDHCHKTVAHQGKGMTINAIRTSGYWIISCNSAVASYIHNCVICRRHRRPTETQKMANLPSERTNVTPPFTYVGCDCFGPFTVKENRKELKRYGLIFTCMASRAIHIELLDSMSTDAFINALRCFISIRGPIRQLHTDKGTNFVGAANELSKAMAESNSNLTSFANDNHFDFVTNPPHSSHMGGVWERQIRTIRNVLNGILSSRNTRLDTSTLRTFLYEAMAIVNCRPLTNGNVNSIDDCTPLSPNQLITMKSRVVLPPPGEFDREDTYSRKRWRVVQGLANEFWSRWRKEYLQVLQVRQKWVRQSPNIKVGDVVLLKDENMHRNQWPLARVIETNPGKDGLVRKVKLMLANPNLDRKGKPLAHSTKLERPIHKIVLLYSSDNQN